MYSSPEGEPDCIPLSTNINLKCKKRMLHFPMDFGELTIDGLRDTGALSSAIPEMDLRKIRLLSPQSVIREGPPPNFQIIVEEKCSSDVQEYQFDKSTNTQRRTSYFQTEIRQTRITGDCQI